MKTAKESPMKPKHATKPKAPAPKPAMTKPKTQTVDFPYSPPAAAFEGKVLLRPAAAPTVQVPDISEQLRQRITALQIEVSELRPAMFAPGPPEVRKAHQARLDEVRALLDAAQMELGEQP
jgi:hypothetical protein